MHDFVQKNEASRLGEQVSQDVEEMAHQIDYASRMLDDDAIIVLNLPNAYKVTITRRNAIRMVEKGSVNADIIRPDNHLNSASDDALAIHKLTGAVRRARAIKKLPNVHVTYDIHLISREGEGVKISHASNLDETLCRIM